MAPSLAEPIRQEATPSKAQGQGEYKEAYGVAGGPSRFDAEVELNGTATQPRMKYVNYLPTWDAADIYPPLNEFEHYEHGRDADPTFPHLLKGARVEKITGSCGAEVFDMQLSQLDSKGKDELALFVAQHRVVAFRNQDFKDLPIDQAVEFARYFGRLHIHPTSPCPAGHPEVHIVHRSADDKTAYKFFDDRISAIAWHTDISYEKQPPGTTFFYNLETPDAGGDTIFNNMVELYNRLSPEFRKRLHGLKAVHVGSEQAAMSKSAGGIMRREAVDSIHPIVRTHPATGEKAIYVNPQFTRRIVGYKKEESDLLLKFLFDQILQAQDLQARVKWQPGTVVVWDNRVAAHTATLDWQDGSRRHMARLTPQAEKPFETPYE